MFNDDLEKLVKQIESTRRATLSVVVALMFVLAFVVIALAGCAHPDMTDREAAAVVELLRR